MPVLDKLACLAGSAAGFVTPLFSRHPGANLRMIQRLDRFGRIAGFEEIVGDERYIKPIALNLTAEIGDPAIWAFVDEKGVIHVGTRNELAKRAPKLLSATLIKRWPVCAADLIRLCDLELVFPDETRRTYRSMVDLLGKGATIWRDTDLILPLIRERLGSRRVTRNSLFDIWTQSIGEVCHIYVPEIVLGTEKPDLSSIAKIAAVWGIKRLEIHPDSSVVTQSQAPTSWPVVGHGGVGRWTVRRIWNVVGPSYDKRLRSRMAGNALEGLLKISSGPNGQAPPNLRIVIHGSAQSNVEAGARLSGPRIPSEIRHSINIRPLGTDPEKRHFFPARSIVETKSAPDYLWVIANHRTRRASAYYDGLARSQLASRYARAGVTSLADLCQSAYGRTILNETKGAHALGLVGATRFLSDMDMYDLLVRALYSMLSPEWTFADSKRIVCLWPRPLAEGSFHQVQIGRHQYRIELIGLEHSRARADVRCLAFDVRERQANVLSYADYLTSVMAAWDWNLRSELGQEMLFEDQGEALSMFVVNTRAELDKFLESQREADVIIVNQRPTLSQVARIQAGDWSVVHHSALPEWLQREYGEPGRKPMGGRVFPVE